MDDIDVLAKKRCPLGVGFVNDLLDSAVNQKGRVVRIFLVLGEITA